MRRPFGGLGPWLIQRLSAVFMLAFIGFVLTHFLVNPPGSYQAWRSWVGHAGVSVATFLFVTALLTHAWVGLRDVTLDYVKPVAARVAILSLIGLSLMGAGIWIVRILWLSLA